MPDQKVECTIGSLQKDSSMLLERLKREAYQGPEVNDRLIEKWEAEYRRLFQQVTNWQLVSRMSYWEQPAPITVKYRPLHGPIRALTAVRSHLIAVRDILNRFVADGLVRRSEEFLSMGREQESLELLEAALKFSPTNGAARRALSRVLSGGEGC